MSRRRNYSDSSDEEDGGYARKRRRQADTLDIEERLESLITRVGEKSTSSLESNLEGLASVLEADLANYKTKILKILYECVVNMPQRMTVYTTLVGLLNAKNYNAGGDFVEILVKQLKEALKTGSHRSARLVLRFLSDLMNCRVIMVSSLLTLYNIFLDVTLEDGIPQARSDWYVYAVLSCLPWVGLELFQKRQQDLERLLAMIENYLKKRQKIHVTTLRVWSVDEGLPQEEYLDCLWHQILNLKRNNWEEHELIRPYIAFDGTLCDALQHTIPTIMLPSHNDDSVYPLPSVVYHMFDYADVPDTLPPLPGQYSLERFIVEEHLAWTIAMNHTERKDCAGALLEPGIKFKVPLNYMIVEMVFGQLFRLPRPEYLELFYGSLLIELCKLQPGSMPQVLAQATEILYERLDSMNTSCIDRFVNWFSYHLSNFQFKWSWDDWSDCLSVDCEAPKPKFVRETLLKSLRLSYHQRITEIIPSSFEKLLPLKALPYYKYEEEGAGAIPGAAIAHRLMQAMKNRCSPDDAQTIINELSNSTNTNNAIKTDVFLQTLLFLGAKSFSHSFSAISKFHSVLKSLSEGRGLSSEDSQICILCSLHGIWKAHQQMMVVLIDKLLKIQVVECSAVAKWIFLPEMSEELTSFYVWEILHGTIKKMIRQVWKLQKEIEEMKDKLEEYEHKRKDGFDMDENFDQQEIPTEDSILAKEEQLDELQSSQKNLFLIIFQRFIMILGEHLTQCEAEGRDYNTPRYKWILERLQQVFLLHHEQVSKYIGTLENLVFTSDIDIHILAVFQQFCALRS